MLQFHFLFGWLLPTWHQLDIDTAWRLNLLIAPFALKRVSFNCCSKDRWRDCKSVTSFWRRLVSRWFIYHNTILNDLPLAVVVVGAIVAAFPNSLAILNYHFLSILPFPYDIFEQMIDPIVNLRRFWLLLQAVSFVCEFVLIERKLYLLSIHNEIYTKRTLTTSPGSDESNFRLTPKPILSSLYKRKKLYTYLSFTKCILCSNVSSEAIISIEWSAW